MMLLHVCCAPCALPILEHLLKEKKTKNITLYFYNPNIYPEEEYIKRLKEVKKISKIYNLKLIIGKYEHDKWLEYLKKSLPHPLESYPENNERCLNCFSFRLDKTAKFAKDNNFNEFTTTLSVNRFKDTKFMNNYGQRIAKEYGLNYLTLDLNSYQAHQKEQELVKKYNLYSQKYCGCEFSILKTFPAR
jgi:epoxyqueuosine reductase